MDSYLAWVVVWETVDVPRVVSAVEGRAVVVAVVASVVVSGVVCVVASVVVVPVVEEGIPVVGNGVLVVGNSVVDTIVDDGFGSFVDAVLLRSFPALVLSTSNVLVAADGCVSTSPVLLVGVAEDEVRMMSSGLMVVASVTGRGVTVNKKV